MEVLSIRKTGKVLSKLGAIILITFSTSIRVRPTPGDASSKGAREVIHFMPACDATASQANDQRPSFYL
eukprot:m.94057 g.94057  ORF g.94057 m.94057 type:complete len:69 (+) comp15002_c0_seq3:392-598(+)